MSKLDELTQKTCSNYGSKGYSIDPLTIIFIAGLILDVIKIIMACYAKDSYEMAVKKINNPSILDKMILKRRIKKNVDNSDIDVDIDIDSLRDSLLEIKLNKQDFTELTLEVNKYRGIDNDE